MLNHLTNYLFQYRSVIIPNVGTIQLVQQPPQLNVVDKLLLPPTYSLELKNGQDVSDHQLNYLDAILQMGKEDVLRDLRFLGNNLREKINGPGFTWEGLGTFTQNTQSITLSIGSLEPVPAQRVIRQDARHKVLVGDQQRLSGQAAENEFVIEKQVGKRSLYMIIGWIVLILSFLVIAFLLYLGKFRVNSTGSKQTPTVFHALKQEKAIT